MLPEIQPESIIRVQLKAPPLSSMSGAGTVVESDDCEAPESGTGSKGDISQTTSVSSSIFCFTYANGRRYHSDRFKEADYFLPNDENEQDRLDLYHHIFLSLLGGKLYTAPLEDPRRVLDVGTGTGIWAIDFADEHPQADVIGTDISPIQPSWVPTNCKFEVDDMEEDWTYPANHFDYVHIRSLSGSFSRWDKVLNQAFEKIAPGGYIEYQDYGCEVFSSNGKMLLGIDPKDAVCSYFHHVVSAAAKAGRPLNVARGMKKMLEAAGFVDVVEDTAIWPLGPWPKSQALKEIGKWAKIGAIESAYPFSVHLLTRDGWSMEEVKAFCSEVEEAFKTGKYYCHGWFVHGRKPDSDEVMEESVPA